MRPNFAIKVAAGLVLALAAWPGEDAQSSTVTASAGSGGHASTVSTAVTAGSGTDPGTGGSNAGGSGSTTDTDGDGMPDDWEDRNGTNRNQDDANDDNDNDGLTNGDEQKYSTYPWNPYSDADLKKDGEDGWALDKDLSPPRLPEPHYAVIDLSEAGAQTTDHPKWINDDGRICMTDSAIWDTGIRTSAPQDFSAKGLANDGYLYGNIQVYLANAYQHAAKWKPGETVSELTQYAFSGDYQYTEFIYAVADNGYVIGSSYYGQSGSQFGFEMVALAWNPELHELFGPLACDYHGVPWQQKAVNNQGFVLGRGSKTNYSVAEGNTWNGTDFVFVEPQNDSFPQCLNNSPIPVLGGSVQQNGYDNRSAALWVKGAAGSDWKIRMFDILSQPTTDTSKGLIGEFDSLNDRVEGIGYFATPYYRMPFGNYCRNGLILNLQDLVSGWSEIEPSDINTSGIIVGRAKPIYDQNGDPVINPTPKPVMLLPTNVITINTFIPQNNVDPVEELSGGMFVGDEVFQGDMRSSGTPKRATWNKDGSHRTQQKFNIIPFRNRGDADGLEDNAYANDPDMVKNDSVLNDVGMSHEYDRDSSRDSFGNLTYAALTDTHLGDHYLKMAQDTASKSGMTVTPTWLGDRKIKFRCVVSATNPLVPDVDNAIDYDFTLTIDLTDASAPKYSLEGNHDGFPAYEVYIGNKRIYQHDPLATGEGLGSLFPPMEHDVNENTSHINQPLP